MQLAITQKEHCLTMTSTRLVKEGELKFNKCRRHGDNAYTSISQAMRSIHGLSRAADTSPEFPGRLPVVSFIMVLSSELMGGIRGWSSHCGGQNRQMHLPHIRCPTT